LISLKYRKYELSKSCSIVVELVVGLRPREVLISEEIEKAK